MQLYICTLLATLIAAWEPVRPGALIREVGHMYIINQSVRVVIHLDNVTLIKDNLNMINQGLRNIDNTMKEHDIENARLVRKISMIKEKVDLLKGNFLQEVNREKRAVVTMAAIGVLAGLGVANLGLHADLRHSVNILENSLGQLDVLQDTTEDIQNSLLDITKSVEQLSSHTANVRESLNIFMLLDQLHIKINELSQYTEQLIQDLVLANIGSVTSTLLPIRNLIEIIVKAKTKWNFTPFFEIDNVALYYPLLTSHLNGSTIIIDIPFSSELKYHIYKFLPFPMTLNGSVVAVDTHLVDPLNYVLSMDNLKESQITNDNLQMCKRTNLDLYLCPSTYFTLREALVSSCAASLVKNVTIFENCHFKVLENKTQHETVQDSHYFFFPHRTTVSVVCPHFNAKVASVTGLYRVPNQCELHSDVLTTIANREQTITLKQEMLLQDIDITLPKFTPPLKINKLHTNRKILTNSHMDKPIIPYTAIFVPITLLFLVTFIFMTQIYRKLFANRTIRHVAA